MEQYPIIRIYALSEEYYNYYTSKEETVGNAIKDVFGESTQVYNNVEGGIGFFGTVTETKHIFTMNQ